MKKIKKENKAEVKKEYKYRLWLIILLTVLCGVVFTVGVAFLVLSIWYVYGFGAMEFKALLYLITSPTKGTGNGTVNEIVGACLPWVIGFVLLYIGCAVLIAGRKHIQMILRRVGAGLCAAVLVTSAIVTLCSFRIPQYFSANAQQTTVYEDYFVDPKNVLITQEGKKKNLIYIYLESMETTYMSEKVGGSQKTNYIPGLTALAQENLSFSDKGVGQMGGFYSVEGATSWTMAALLATSSGVPFSFPVASNDMTKFDNFAPGLTTLGDILEDNGYTNEFLCGSDATFGGRRNYYTQHGNYRIFDIYTARNKGYIAPDYYNNFWGFEDKYLFQIAKDELTNLSNEGNPFNFTMLTVDTHYPKGYACSECGTSHDPEASYDGQYRNTLECSDRLVTEFISWCKQQDFYKDTVIIISGDHPVMGKSLELIEGYEHSERRMYNCILNSETTVAEGAANNRLFASVDMFPTTLAALGFNIEGNKLGLGVNMFSGEKTISEQKGIDFLCTELLKNSEYYDAITGFYANDETDYETE